MMRIVLILVAVLVRLSVVVSALGDIKCSTENDTGVLICDGFVPKVIPLNISEVSIEKVAETVIRKEMFNDSTSTVVKHLTIMSKLYVVGDSVTLNSECFKHLTFLSALRIKGAFMLVVDMLAFSGFKYLQLLKVVDCYTDQRLIVTLTNSASLPLCDVLRLKHISGNIEIDDTSLRK
ncbi:hypothetical protein DPMN_179368 [Dreissena polymorpha]|uniref:Receptor L-domain domain-containing protein n=1 Tax=Dreissena polymorpha TaxID=45954 RepID=A0A9D4IM35_DREPO|nr:hypothetical protein DPMN_179368 [Dreissena polymorpha]